MKKTKVKITLLVLVLGFLLMVTPYVKPKQVSYERKQIIDKKIKDSNIKQDRVYLVSDSIEALNVRLAMIQSAKERIDLSTYIIHQGETTDLIFSELIKAADRGVKVQIMTDYKLGGTRGRFGITLSSHPNINIYNYNPVSLFNIRSWQSVHHEKYLVVDGNYALVGGRNIGDKYFTESTSVKTVKDLDVFVWSKNGLADELHDYANEFISKSEIKQVKKNVNKKNQRRLDRIRSVQGSHQSISQFEQKTVSIEGLTFLTNPYISTETQGEIAYGLTKLAEQTEEIAIVQTPYATAHKSSLEILTSLQKKGVFVSMVTNSIASSPNYPAFSNYYKNKEAFLETGISVYEYQSHGENSLHRKAYRFDDTLVIGSLNLDDRSFFVNTEMVLVIKSPGLIEQFNQDLEKVLNQSYAVQGDTLTSGIETEYEVSWLKKTLMNLSSIFSRLFSFLV